MNLLVSALVSLVAALLCRRTASESAREPYDFLDEATSAVELERDWLLHCYSLPAHEHSR